MNPKFLGQLNRQNYRFLRLEIHQSYLKPDFLKELTLIPYFSESQKLSNEKVLLVVMDFQQSISL